MKRISRVLIFIFAINLIVTICGITAKAGNTDQDAMKMTSGKVIRVGYMDYKGFIECQKNGTYKGYAVSYLNEIAKHTGWSYEYKFDSWENCLEKLESGELDLLCSAQYTEERGQIFEYSEMAIGSESAVLYAKPGATDIYYNDFATFDGMTIGVLDNSYQRDILPAYAQEHGFSYQEEVFASETAMVAALKGDKVDLIASGSLALHRDLTTVGVFGSAPFYLTTGKQNADLMKPINQALIEIKDANPYFESELYKQFYSASATTTFPLYTREEAEFIAKTDTIEIGFLSDGYPLSSYDAEAEQCVGILEDILKMAEEKSGLTFSFVPISGEKRPVDRLKDGEYDLIAGLNRSELFLEDPELQLSNTMLESNAVIVQKKGTALPQVDGANIAIPMEYQYLADYITNQYKDCTIIFKDDTEACMDSVLSGESDIAIQNSYVISYLLQKPRFSNLTILTAENIPEMLCVIGNDKVDPTLISILNKSLDCLEDDSVQQVVMKHTIASPYEGDLSDFLYKYRASIVIALLLLCMIAAAFRQYSKGQLTKAVQDKETQMLLMRVEYDALTGIYNRDTFYEKVKAVLGENPGAHYDILCLDIDRFKIVNDLYGSEEGDRLLKYVAATLNTHVTTRGGICGRIGGNSFAAYVPHDEVALRGLYEFTKGEIDKYGLTMDLSCRFGVYCIEDEPIPVEAMCDRAQMAMERVKGNAIKHVGIYNKKQRMELLREQDIINDMYTALKEEQFQLYIQPKCELETGVIIGGEALVRWIHPARGFISPAEFIPIFEKNGFITKLDEFMWEKTCQCIHRWKLEGKKVLPISVNISRMNFYATDVKKDLLNLLEKYDILTEELELEVTESAFSEDDAVIYAELQNLQKAGFKILMDDFGCGYSSLNMLKEAPIDVIKMDLKFIQGPDPMGRSGDILQGIMEMAENMQLPVIAEGVETRENVEMLTRIHCKMAQGFYFSRPIPEEEFEKFLM